MAKMMFACVLAYTLAWLPLNIYNVLRDIPGLLDALNETTHITLFFVVHWLAMSHTCYNPFIYFWMNSKFRAGYYRALGCLPCLAGVLRLASSPTDGTMVRSGTYSSRYGTPKCHVRSLQGAAPTGPATSLKVLGPAPPHAGAPTLHYHNHHHQCPPSPASSAQPGLAVLYVVLVLLREHGRMRGLLSRPPRPTTALILDPVPAPSGPPRRLPCANPNAHLESFESLESLRSTARRVRIGERERSLSMRPCSPAFVCSSSGAVFCAMLHTTSRRSVYFLSVIFVRCSIVPLFSRSAVLAQSITSTQHQSWHGFYKYIYIFSCSSCISIIR
ncbi:uncharacterized protein [Penaeus vannamei]|uniref:uncharacterized protein n=1 Tax=Penaeus vannamei TaxID=6689 RepID=UPI00387F3C63